MVYIIFSEFFFFFFSSRRRHTRSLCDWSSDVCSSDLWRLRRKTQEDKESIGGQPGGRGQGTPRAGRMSDEKDLPSLVRFGAFEVSFESRELRKRGVRIQLEEKPFQILETLIESAGQVVRRKTLCEKLWPDTYVAFNHSLNTAVNKLRNILGDLAKSPRFIETLPRLGYRFVAPVQWESRNRLCDAGRTLVVLPFENLSGEPGMDRF